MSAAGGVPHCLMSRSWRSGGPHDDGGVPGSNVQDQERPVLYQAGDQGETSVSSQMLKYFYKLRLIPASLSESLIIK